MLKPKVYCSAGGKGALEAPPRPTLLQAGLTSACSDPSQAARRADVLAVGCPMEQLRVATRQRHAIQTYQGCTGCSGAGEVHPPPLLSDECIGPAPQVRKPYSSPITRPEPSKEELRGQSTATLYEEVQKHAEGAATSSRDLPGLLSVQCRSQPEAPWTHGHIFQR